MNPVDYKISGLIQVFRIALRVVTTTSLGPFGTNAEGCTIDDLLDP